MDPTEQDRRETLEDLFAQWDLDGNGSVGFGELMQVLQSSERKSDKNQAKWVRKIEAQINQGRQANRSRRGSGGSTMALKMGGVINFPDHDGEPSLDPEAFVSFLYHITHKDTDEEFADFVAFCRSGVEAAAEQTHGSKSKKAAWKMFQLLDVNHDGFVDLTELEVLLNAESKADKKHVAKWKAYLYNKGRDNDKVREEDINDDTKEKYNIKMSLHDFQSFVAEYMGDDENKVYNLLTSVEKAVQAKQLKYLTEFKVQDIMNDIMGDILKERPRDVLAGIAKSVQRLQRTGAYPKMLGK